MGEGNIEQEETQTSKKHGGGWITFPFIIGSFGCITLTTGGWLANLIVYLIKEYNINNINATLIFNIVNGCICIFPVVGAVLADSFFGSFFVIVISTSISLLGMISLTLTATIHSLRPQPCDDHNNTSITCSSSPSKLQYTILYLSIILVCRGSGGSRFTTATFGANQYDTIKNQNIFINWFFVTFYVGFIASSTAIVYIQDSVSWSWGFGICLAANAIALVVFLFGKRFYRLDKPIGNPFTALARVLVANAWKRLDRTPSATRRDNVCYYYGKDDHHFGNQVGDGVLTKKFRCLNRAALITQGDVHLDGTIAKPWRLCKVQEVEDFKTLLKIFPLWSTGIFLAVPITSQGSFIILQALTMDRHLGSNFKIPAGSFSVIIFMSTAISLTLIDRFLYPIWEKLIGRVPRPLERVGLGHILNILSMIVSALVESKRLKIAHAHLPGQAEAIVPISSLWLFPQLVLVGIGEAFHFPGQVGLYYQEFPMSLRSTVTALISLMIGIAYYLSTTLIDLFHRVAKWLPDDINQGRLDNVYWTISVIGVINFGYYLVCAKCYKYQHVEHDVKDDSTIED